MSKRLVPVAVCLLALAVPSLEQSRFEATPGYVASFIATKQP